MRARVLKCVRASVCARACALASMRMFLHASGREKILACQYAYVCARAWGVCSYVYVCCRALARTRSCVRVFLRACALVRECLRAFACKRVNVRASSCARTTSIVCVHVGVRACILEHVYKRA